MDLKVFTFVELTADKVPKSPVKKLNYYEAMDRVNVGVYPTEPFVVLDVDDGDSAQKMYKWCQKYNIKSAVMKTTRGLHFWFKNDKKLKNVIATQNAIGVKCDVRSFGNHTPVMVKRNNQWREWVNDVTISEIDYLPKELTPITDKMLNEAPTLGNISVEGEGRRNSLFARVIPLANNGFSKEEIIELFHKINETMFTEPLPERELKNIFTDDKIFEIKPKFNDYFSDETHSFLHHKFATDLHSILNGCYKNKQYYFYNDKYYTYDERYLFQKMNEIIPSLKQNQRVETLHYLRTLKNVKNLITNEYAVALQNGIYDFKENKFKPHNPDYFITNLINCEYNARIQSHETVDKFINEITCNDIQLRYVLEEILGYCFISNTSLQKAFILKGYGANGKSTFLDVIKELVGVQNLSAVGMEELEERFKRSALVDKLVNISSELPETNLKNLHVFKKLVTGDEIDAEFKGKDSFNLKNTAKLIFSANELPKMNDTTEGFIRRLLIIPFNNYFSELNRDTDMLEKLTTEDAKSYWFNLAINGWNRLSRNRNFTHCKAIDKEIKQWIDSMNSIRRWFSSHSFNLTKYYNKTLNQTYIDYQQFCTMNNNGKFMSLWKLKEELQIRFKNIYIDENEVIYEKVENNNE